VAAEQTLSIADFRHGLDVRRSPLTAPGGSLQVLDNAFINDGGEIEKRKAFVQVATLPATTYSLFDQGGKLHTFGTADPATVGTLPDIGAVPIIYHQLAGGGTIDGGHLDIDSYKGKFSVSGAIGGVLTSWYDGALRTPPGNYNRAFKSKMYSTNGNLLQFSSVDNPAISDNTPANPGGGFIDLSQHDADVEELGGIEIYIDNLAVFARLATQIWAVDPDPTLNTLKQVIRVGSLAPHSIFQFGTGDVLFLSDSGIRSLRALNYTLAAGVVDVGSPIDRLVRDTIRQFPTAAEESRATVQPVAGRYWLNIGNTVFVLSFFPSGKISAWSTFTIPFTVEAWARVANRVYCRSGNAVYLYGGLDDTSYDTSLCRVRTPHLAADRPTIMKRATAASLVASGAWSMSIGGVVNNPDLFELVANVNGTTLLPSQRIAVNAHSTHFALEFTSNDANPAVLSAAAIDFKSGEKL
jgi:hypothetical protein